MAKAADNLSAFVGASPNAPQAADAFLKLGYCHQRLAEVQAMPAEKAKNLASARSAYEQLMQRFPNHSLHANALFERARVLAQQGDVNGAIGELRKFATDRQKDSPVAPMALLRLATLLRTQNQAQQAAEVLDKCRQAHEANLAKDPERAAWIPLLQYHHGLALKESNKLPEARAVFDLVVRTAGNKPEAIEAALRHGQCFKD